MSTSASWLQVPKLQYEKGWYGAWSTYADRDHRCNSNNEIIPIRHCKGVQIAIEGNNNMKLHSKHCAFHANMAPCMDDAANPNYHVSIAKTTILYHIARFAKSHKIYTCHY